VSPNGRSPTTATAAAAAAADLAFFQLGATPVVAQKRYLFILVAADFKVSSSSAPD